MKKNFHLLSCYCLVLWKCLPPLISVLIEWSIDTTAVFSCKTSTFHQKYILNEIQDMTLVVLCKYINYTVDKLLALTLVTNYIANYSKVIIFLY